MSISVTLYVPRYDELDIQIFDLCPPFSIALIRKSKERMYGILYTSAL
jgi:hypothetical protein